jgi:benzoylformate decarboxylase
VPASIARARHEAVAARGPALVIVPMDDWSAEALGPEVRAAPGTVVRARTTDREAVAAVADLVGAAKNPTLVVGAGADDPATWKALVALAERLSCPVWQEPFSARAGFPQDHPLFAGNLPFDRPRLRATLAPYDAVVVVGGPAFRQYPFHPGPFVEPGTRVAVISEDPAEVHRSTAELAVIAHPGPICAELARLVPARDGAIPERAAPPAPPVPPASGEQLRAGHVFAAMADRLSRDTILIEESPSNRPELLSRLPAREPLGFLSPAMGGLGFALPAATGLRMARPDRPVVAVVGDGASLYSIQSLWSAAHYGAGALFVVLSNGGYAIMDRLAEEHGGRVPWPGFGVDVAGLARAFGCPARTVSAHDELLATFDEVLPTLGDRTEPLLLEIAISPDESFAP